LGHAHLSPLEAPAFPIALPPNKKIRAKVISFFDRVEDLRNNCHKRWRLVKLRNLFMEFEVSFIFHVNVYFKNSLI
jgi:hypothetical protein